MPQVTYEELAQRYGPAVASNIVRMLEEGVAPSLIRELDYLTGAVHWEYAMPHPTGNANLWQVSLTPEGEIDPTSIRWVGPGPAPGPPPTPVELMTGRREGVTQFPSITVSESRPTVSQPIQAAQSQQVPVQPAGPGGTQQPVAGTDRLRVEATMNDVDRRIIEQAGGDQFYTWDQWNWFYEQVTGRPGPAPEDRGLRRNADGSVTINGSTRFNYATWKAYAFGGGATSAGVTTPNQQVQQGFLAQLIDLLRKLVKLLIGGGRGAV